MEVAQPWYILDKLFNKHGQTGKKHKTQAYPKHTITP